MSVRFAPSPTGDFHAGNFRTAWISCLWARRLGLPWVVRFEDIDQPRVVAGARERQLLEMERLGLRADLVELQSGRSGRHRALFTRARELGRIYPCVCSRKEVQEALLGIASAPHGDAPVYNGRCREGVSPAELGIALALAWRFRGDAADGSQDFIVARTAPHGAAANAGGSAAGEEFVPAYHWACAIDDFDGRHALLVRAWDLAAVTAQHRMIHAWLGELEGAREFPAVYHTTLVTQDDGHRLEKRTRGVTLRELEARGIAPDELLARFSRSFDKAELEGFSPARVWGEKARESRIGELLGL